MNNLNRPMLNLDLDLLRTFVAVADLDTFATAAVVVSRTQSAVSQQMQRLEQLIGKELFTRHGRNKFLTEHGIQLLGYARKILRFNDEACISLIYSNLQGSLTIGVSDDAAETIMPFLLNRVSAIYPKIVLDVRVKRNDFTAEILHHEDVDLMLTASNPGDFPHKIIRKSPTLWYCAADYVFQNAEPVPLVILNDTCSLPDLAIAHLNSAGVSWRPSYIASTLAGVKTAVKEGLGITSGPVEMMSPDLRVIGLAEGLPLLPDTQYSLCRRLESDTELTLAVFNAMEPNRGYHLSSAVSDQSELQQVAG